MWGTAFLMVEQPMCDCRRIQKMYVGGIDGYWGNS